MGRVKIKAMIIIAVALALVVFSYPAALAATDPYSGATTGTLGVSLTDSRTLSSDGVQTGTRLVLSGSGFNPNSKYSILWDGEVVLDPYADANGNVSYTYMIPRGASAGIHTVGIKGVDPSGKALVLSTDVKVVAEKSAKKSSSYPFTGGGTFHYLLVLEYLLLAGVVLTVLGIGIRFIRKAR